MLSLWPDYNLSHISMLILIHIKFRALTFCVGWDPNILGLNTALVGVFMEHTWRSDLYIFWYFVLTYNNRSFTPWWDPTSSTTSKSWERGTVPLGLEGNTIWRFNWPWLQIDLMFPALACLLGVSSVCSPDMYIEWRSEVWNACSNVSKYSCAYTIAMWMYVWPYRSSGKAHGNSLGHPSTI